MNRLNLLRGGLFVLAAALCAWLSPSATAQHENEKGTMSAQAEVERSDFAQEGDAQGPDAHVPDSHGGGGSTNPLTIDPDLAIWNFIVFLVLLAVLGKFAWKPIIAGLDKREHSISEHIAAAERANAEAKAMLAQYEQKLAKAQEEVRGILDEARRDAEHTQQEILAKARDDARHEMDRGRREIETATAQALKQLAETSANLAVDLAGKIVQARLSASDHSRLIEEALASFPKGDFRQN